MMSDFLCEGQNLIGLRKKVRTFFIKSVIASDAKQSSAQFDGIASPLRGSQ